jgi:hypothetical protein
MHIRRVLPEFDGKNAQVFTADHSFRGMFKYDDTNGVVVVRPVEGSVARQYGPAFIDAGAIIAIRLVLPKDETENDGNEDCGP